MIVIVTNRQDYTADFLILELQDRRAEYVRFNTEDFPQAVQLVLKIDDAGFDGYFSLPKAKVNFKDITSIWYRRPVHPVPSADIGDPLAQEFATVESQASLDGVWRILDCFWVSHPDSLRKAEIKLHQLKVAARVGFQLPSTLLTNNSEAAEEFCRKEVGSIIYKPLRHGRLIRDEIVNLVYTNLVTIREMQRFDLVKYAPSLFQRHIMKQVEIRATVIGDKVFAVGIHSQDYPDSCHDWRRGDISQLRHEPHILPHSVALKCVSLVKEFGLAFGAIDLILTPEGEYVFLEINPNGQWAWIQQLCPNIPLRESLADLLISGGRSDNASGSEGHR